MNSFMPRYKAVVVVQLGTGNFMLCAQPESGGTFTPLDASSSRYDVIGTPPLEALRKLRKLREDERLVEGGSVSYSPSAEEVLREWETLLQSVGPTPVKVSDETSQNAEAEKAQENQATQVA